MNIDVINLGTHAHRWDAVATQLKALGLAPTRREATAGASITLRDLNGLYSQAVNRRSYHRPLLPGEIGCYLSHRAAWQRLLDSGHGMVAVFEDDVECDDDLPLILDKLARQTGGWEMVKLIGRGRESISAAFPFGQGRELIEYGRVPSLTSAYVINRSGAAKLLANAPFGRPVDVDLRHWWECDLHVAGVFPYPVRRAASSGASTIEDRQVRPDLRMRLQKLWLQAVYTTCNWRARLQRRRNKGFPESSQPVPRDAG
jgi:glycosyl transferase, family 25